MKVTEYRRCARCGKKTVPRGIAWPQWEDGMPVGLECIKANPPTQPPAADTTKQEGE